jgi:hypothetical protein
MGALAIAQAGDDGVSQGPVLRVLPRPAPPEEPTPEHRWQREPRQATQACSSPLVELANRDACHRTSCRYFLVGDTDGHRCALLWADRGGMTLEEVGTVIGVCRERVRQIEEAALARPAFAVLLDERRRLPILREEESDET